MAINPTGTMNEWNGWQIPHTGVYEPDRSADARTDVFIRIRRASDMRLSSFGALNIGPRMGQGVDYTRTELYFQSKDELADFATITADTGLGHNFGGLRSMTVERNPYLWGSTVKKFRDDQFFRMTMEHYQYRTGLEDFGDYSASDPHYVDKPKWDVMDTMAADAAGMEQYKNYPREGWHSFGGKYDFLPYGGVLGRPRGNKGE